MFKSIMNAIKSAWGFVFGSGEDSLGPEFSIKFIAMEIFKNNAGLAGKVVSIIADILKAVNSKSITDYADVQALIDQALINVVLNDEERLLFGLLIKRVKAKFLKEMDSKIFKAGKDFTVAVQYLGWVQEEAEKYSSKA